MENQVVRYKGQKYKKVFECVDSINACDMCCFCAIDDNGLSKCEIPNDERFYGCGEGKFYWKKEEKKAVMVSIKNQVIKDDKLNLYFDFYSEYYLRFYNYFIQIPFKKIEWGYDNEDWFDGNTFNKKNVFDRNKTNKDIKNSFWKKVFGDFEKNTGFVFGSAEKQILIKDFDCLYSGVNKKREKEFPVAIHRKAKELKRKLYYSLIRPKINQKFYETIEKMSEEEKKNEHEIKKIYEEIASDFNKEYYDICADFVKKDDKKQEEIRKEIETKFPLPYKEAKNKKKCFFEMSNLLFGIDETKEKNNIYMRKILFSKNFELLKEFINKKCELRIVEETKRMNAFFEGKQKEYKIKQMEEKFKYRASKDIEFFEKFVNKGNQRHYFTVPLKEDIKNLKRVKLSRRNGVWAFDYIYEQDNKECSERVEDKYCYIDIGGKNTLAYVIDGEKPVLISGEKFNDYIEKYQTQKSYMQAKTAKTYNVEEVYPESLQKIDNIWNNRIELITNDIKNLFINHILESGVTNVVYGWNEGIKEEKKEKKEETTESKETKEEKKEEEKKEEKKSKKNSKGLYLFRVTPHKKLMELIESKLKLYGIKVESINESYTSKVDALLKESIPEGFVKGVGFDKDGNKKRTNRDTYISEYEIDGKRVEINADINGALNIGRKYMKDKKIDKDVVDCQDINDLLNPRIIYDLQEELKKYRKKS